MKAGTSGPNTTTSEPTLVSAQPDQSLSGETMSYVLRAPELKRAPTPTINIIPFSKLVSSDKATEYRHNLQC